MINLEPEIQAWQLRLAGQVNYGESETEAFYGYRTYLQEHGLNFATDQVLTAVNTIQLANQPESGIGQAELTAAQATYLEQATEFENHQRLADFVSWQSGLEQRDWAVSALYLRQRQVVGEMALMRLVAMEKGYRDIDTTKKCFQLIMMVEQWPEVWVELAAKEFAGEGFSLPLTIDQLAEAHKLSSKLRASESPRGESVARLVKASRALVGNYITDHSNDNERIAASYLSVSRLLRPYAPEQTRGLAAHVLRSLQLIDTPSWQNILDEEFTTP